jgi:phosphatidate cytidylyltransferase
MVYQSKAYNFILRLISACVLAPIVLLMINLSGFYFTGMILLAAIILGGEWFSMTAKKSNFWKFSGILYILIACLSLLWIIKQNYLISDSIKINGVSTVISIFVLVWANDIGSYFFGRLIGGAKLCPKISPNKTWSGFFGGIAAALAVSPVVGEGLGAAGIVAIIASIGDLLESWAKRKCDIKDSGALIPGHGGLLDRVDGILLVAIFVAILGLIAK